MPTEATEVLTPDEARRQLRISPDTDPPNVNDPFTPIVASAINSAVSFVAEAADVPLLDVTDIYRVTPVGNNHSLCVQLPFGTEVMSVKAWGAAQAYREEPSIDVPLAGLGRIVYQKKATYIYPPATGWPERRDNSPIRVAIKRSFTIGKNTEVLRQAIIVLMREFYNGYSEIPPLHAVWPLISTGSRAAYSEATAVA